MYSRNNIAIAVSVLSVVVLPCPVLCGPATAGGAVGVLIVVLVCIVSVNASAVLMSKLPQLPHQLCGEHLNVKI